MIGAFIFPDHALMLSTNFIAALSDFWLGVSGTIIYNLHGFERILIVWLTVVWPSVSFINIGVLYYFRKKAQLLNLLSLRHCRQV